MATDSRTTEWLVGCFYRKRLADGNRPPHHRVARRCLVFRSCTKSTMCCGRTVRSMTLQQSSQLALRAGGVVKTLTFVRMYSPQRHDVQLARCAVPCMRCVWAQLQSCYAC